MNMSISWILMCGAFIFFMQAGFTCYEVGFIRSKNIISVAIENLLTFMIVTVLYCIFGFGFMFGESFHGLIGTGFIGLSGLDAAGDAAYSYAFMQTMFAAASITIFGGAMSERSRLSALLAGAAVSAVVIYPVFGHWAWGSMVTGTSGWLEKLGFMDFAGASVVHLTGGFIALAGIITAGRRKDTGPARSNIPFAVLGVFILWFGWFGFNGGSVITSGAADKVGNVFLNTILSAGIAAVAAMITSKIRYRKADISMTINGILAGLVAITCGCDQYTPLTACLIGIFAGVFSIIAIQFVDKVLKIDDPVGAIGVHGFCGILGTLLAGLFSKTKGLFYTGNADFFLTQLLGSAVVVVFVLVIMGLAFTLIKHTSGLRVSAAEEIEGLDNREHGLNSAYGDFVTNSYTEILQSGPSKTSEHEKLVPITLDNSTQTKQASSISKVEVIMKRSRFEAFKEAMNRIEVTGMTVSQVVGCGMQKGQTDFYRGTQVDINLIPKIKVEIVIAKVPVETVVNTARDVLYTGHIGDGKIFVYDVRNVIKVRTGEVDYDAMQGTTE